MFIARFGDAGPTTWVAPDGSDAADGTEAAPLLTIGKAAQRGGLVLLKPGVYTDRIDIRSALPVRVKAIGPVTFRAVGGPAFVVDGETIYERPVNHYIAGARIYLEGIIIRADNQLELHDSTLHARRCAFEYLGYHNLQAFDCSTLLQECVSEHSLNGDGFNYYGGQAIEVDCTARFNGCPGYHAFDGNANKQGSSIHQGTQILRVNGQYGSNFGQAVADTGAEGRTWMVGSICAQAVVPRETLWTEGTATLNTVRCVGTTALYDLWIESGTTSVQSCEITTIGGAGNLARI